MSTLYLFALVGVCMIFFAVLIEAVVSISRPLPWATPQRRLTLVKTLERRRRELPFVGVDRRADADGRLPGPADDSRRRA